MRFFLLCLSAAVAVACGSATEPGRDNAHCLYPGDTTGYAPLIQTADSLIVACFWILETDTRVRCYVGTVTKFSAATDCVVGEKWKGA